MSHAQGQITPSLEKLDFGEVDRGSDRLHEFVLVNENSQQVSLLRVQTKSSIFDIRTDKREIPPRDSMTVRIKLNPVRTGNVRDELTIFFGKETVRIPIRAEVKYVDAADNLPCPDFDRTDPGAGSDWSAYFKVIDRDTGKPLKKAEIVLSGRAGHQIIGMTDASGIWESTLPIDFYDIQASRAGYAKYTMESYINRRNKDFILELMSGEMGSVVVRRPGALDTEKEEEKEPKAPEEETVKEELSETEEEAMVEQHPEFSLTEYRPNNVVFLVDISTSMRKQDRIELLKSSMIELAHMLRPQDIISIVTYATTTDVVLSGQAVKDSQEIEAIIAGLQAEGKTAGEAGLKQAYTILKRHYIEQGNNQVYIATDGAFDHGSDKVRKLVSKKANRGMRLSVLSIRASRWVDEKMQELAETGKGRHLSLQEDSDRENLRELIKQQSKRK
ncbi:MAG: VWA domain-containing protein [Flavobacteriales bacterium]|nr:VWA domain-containing protein [Flavobacteriales bacterium]